MGIEYQNFRLIHLSKYASFLDRPVSGLNGSNKRIDRVELSFYTFGYHDNLVYCRLKDNSVASYEYSFGIKYAYVKSERNLVADQLFTLIDADEFDEAADPFECTEGETIHPFLGMILISVECINKEYERALENIKNKAENYFKDKYGVDASKIMKCFYILNCANLCLVLRTDSIKDFYDASNDIKSKCFLKEEEKGEYEFSVTSIMNCVLYKNQNKLGQQVIEEKNGDITVNMRLSADIGVERKNDDGYISIDIPADVQEEREASKVDIDDAEVFGVLGFGEYGLRIPFSKYMSLYPLFCQCKYNGTNAAPMSVLMVHERFEFKNVRMGVSTIPDFQYSQKMISLLSKKVEEISLHKYDVPKCKYAYIQEISLIRDLCYAYNDLWFRNSKNVNGYIFYMQMWVLVNGIERYVEAISENMKLDLKQAKEETDELCEVLIDNMRKTIININNYNKMMQTYHQDKVNYPGYEIQSKVNIEKYMLAYSMYLQHVYSVYANDEKNPRGVKKSYIYILVTLDFSIGNIEAEKSFCLTDNNGQGIALYTVKFPDYRRFANVYHVLPLLTHEISHEFRYSNSKARNRFLIKFIVKGLSRQLAYQLFWQVSDDRHTYISEMLLTMLHKPIHQCMEEEILKYLHGKGEGNSFGISVENGSLVDIVQGIKLYMHNNMMAVEEKKPLHLLVNKEFEQYRKYWQLLYARLHRAILGDKKKEESGRIRLIDLFVAFLTDIEIVKGHLSVEADKLKYYSKSFAEITRGCAEDAGIKEMRSIGQLWEKDACTRSDFYRVNHKLIVFCMEMLAGCMSSNLNEPLKECIYKLVEMENLHDIENTLDELFKRALDQNRIEILELSERSMDIVDMLELCSQIKHIMKEVYPDNQKSIYSSEHIITNIYRKLHSEYERACDEKSHDYILMLARNNYKRFAAMGIDSQSSDLFVKEFQTVLKNIAPDVNRIIDDEANLYQECYADLGMCAAFSFSVFGYLHFIFHIMSEQNGGAESLGQDMASDRIYIVTCAMMQSLADKKSGFNDIAAYRKNLICSYSEWLKCVMQTSDDRSGSYMKIIHCLYSQIEDLSKMETVDEKNIKVIKAIYYQQQKLGEIIREEKTTLQAVHVLSEKNNNYFMLRFLDLYYLLRFLIRYRETWEEGSFSQYWEFAINKMGEVYFKKIQTSSWIAECQKDETIRKIGQYYNSVEVRSLCKDSNKPKGDLQVTQPFIMKYYSLSKSTYGKIISQTIDRQRGESSQAETDKEIASWFQIFREECGGIRL